MLTVWKNVNYWRIILYLQNSVDFRKTYLFFRLWSIAAALEIIFHQPPKFICHRHKHSGHNMAVQHHNPSLYNGVLTKRALNTTLENQGKYFLSSCFLSPFLKRPPHCVGCTRRPRDGVCTLLYVPFSAFDVAKILFEFRDDDVITEYKLITYLRLSSRLPCNPAALQATSEHEICFIFKYSCLLHALH